MKIQRFPLKDKKRLTRPFHFKKNEDNDSTQLYRHSNYFVSNRFRNKSFDEITFFNASWDRITTQSSFKDTFYNIQTFSQSTTQFRVSATLSRQDKNSNDHCQSSLYNGYKLNETGQNQCFSVDKIKCREITSLSEPVSIKKNVETSASPFSCFFFFFVFFL